MKKLIIIPILLLSILCNAQFTKGGGLFLKSGSGFMSAPVPPIENDFLTSLVAYWKFEEGSGTLDDAVGSNNSAANVADYGATGKSGNCLSFTATNSDYVTLTDAAALQMYNQDFTFAAWIYLNSSPASSSYFGIIGGETNAASMDIYGVNRRLIVSKVAVSNGELSTAPNAGEWVFVAIAFDSDAATDNALYYANGSSDYTTYDVDFNDGAGSIYIGRYSTTGYFNGLIDEVMIWKGRTLTLTELNTLYNSGAGLFFDDFN